MFIRFWSCWIATRRTRIWSGTTGPEPSWWSSWRRSRRATSREWDARPLTHLLTFTPSHLFTHCFSCVCRASVIRVSDRSSCSVNTGRSWSWERSSSGFTTSSLRFLWRWEDCDTDVLCSGLWNAVTCLSLSSVSESAGLESVGLRGLSGAVPAHSPRHDSD